MHESLAVYGYPALFLVSFLASTLLPLGSEWLLVALLLKSKDPLVATLIATAGNYLGACSCYAIGIYGGNLLAERLLRVDASARERAERFFRRYGSWSLLLSWLPIIGDPLCLVGGLLRVPFTRFSLLVVTGKAARYGAIAWLTLKGMQAAAT